MIAFFLTKPLLSVSSVTSKSPDFQFNGNMGPMNVSFICNHMYTKLKILFVHHK